MSVVRRYDCWLQNISWNFSIMSHCINIMRLESGELSRSQSEIF